MIRNLPQRRRCMASLCLLAIVLPSTAKAVPAISNLSVRGHQAGETTTLVISGTDLLPAPRLLLSVPIDKQVVLPNSTPTTLRVQVTVSAKAAAGIYNLRVASAKGVSRSTIIAVDSLPQLALAEKVAKLPVALHGQVAGAGVIRTTFDGKAGQSFIAEVEAKRFGAKLRPVVHLYDGQRRQVAMALPSRALQGDARLRVKLPDDGLYTVEVHDLEYAAPAPSYLRLKLGDFKYADLAFPPAISRSKPSNVVLIGNPGSASPLTIDPTKLSKDYVLFPTPWPVGGASGARPRVQLSEFSEVVEQAVTDPKKVQALPAVPTAVSGRLLKSGEKDRFRLSVTDGQKIRIEVFADRIGSPIDSMLELRNDKGAALTRNDDVGNTSDSRIDYTVPKGMKTIDVVISDQLEAGGESNIYRVAITPLGQPSTPTFELTAAADTWNLPKQGQLVVRVTAKRSGYDGPIKLSFEGLPPGIQAAAADIPAGGTGTLVTLTSKAEIAPSVMRVRGTSVGVKVPISKLASFAHPLAQTQPWLTSDVAVGGKTANQSSFRIEWAPSGPIVVGSTMQLPVKLVRPRGHIGQVDVSLISSVSAPLVKGKPNNNVIVRAGKVVQKLDPKAKAALDRFNAVSAEYVKVRAVLDKAVKEAQKKVDFATLQVQVAMIEKADATKATREAIAAVGRLRTAEQDAQKALELAAAAAVAATVTETKATFAARLQDAVDKLSKVRKEFSAKSIALRDASEQLLNADAKVTKNSKLAADAKAAMKRVAQSPAGVALSSVSARRVNAEVELKAVEARLAAPVNVGVIVPPTVSEPQCDLCLQAVLRSIDGKTILAEVYSPVRRHMTVHPLDLQPAASAVEAVIDAKAGATVKLTGKVLRKFGFAGDITVSLTGLPKGVAVPKAVVKPGQSDFELVVKFPANSKPSELKNIKLFATGPFDPKAAKVTVRTEKAVTIKLSAPGKKAKK